MKNFFGKLIRQGSEHHIGNETNLKYNAVSNQILLIFIGGILLFLTYSFTASIYLHSESLDFRKYYSYLLPPILLMLSILLICFFMKNRTGNNVFYLSIAFISGIAYLTYMSAAVGLGFYAFLLFFTLIPLPFFVFGKERFRMIIAVESILCFFLFAVIWYRVRFSPLVYFPDNIAGVTNYALIFLTALILMTCSYYLWNETILSEEKLFRERQRTEEALASLHVLKTQQDGDYFLTSLLTAPLNSVNVQSENAETEIFLKSKKQFSFKDRNKELGGDLNIVDSIQLAGKKYIVFLNGDAMGKSMQGAGGALVLGAAFKSLIIRANTDSDDTVHPEIWLKQTFLELGQIFETFNGSMFVSAVIGLLEEDTGFVYYINAEHPFLTLYRDGYAEYIENELVHRKLGISGFNSTVRVKFFQMLNGDCLISGSDGRDDILIQTDEGKEMNIDDSLFLRAVEKADGDLKLLHQALMEYGEITDDLSFLKIKYKGKTVQHTNRFQGEHKEIIYNALREKNSRLYNEALNLFKLALDTLSDNLFLLKQIAVVSLRVGNFEDALFHSLKVVDAAPQETRFLFYTSYAYFRLGEIQKAAYYSERVFLREPENLKNIIHLARLHQMMNNTKQADHYSSVGLKLDPENQALLKLREC